MAEEQVVVFRLGAEEYAISIANVKEIIRYEGVTKLPNTPDYMEGIINLRGKIIPVIELAKRFALPATGSTDRRVLVVETAGRDVAMIVDDVTEVRHLADSAIEGVQTLVGGGNNYIRGIGKDAGRLLILLDVNKLFDSAEMANLQQAG